MRYSVHVGLIACMSQFYDVIDIYVELIHYMTSCIFCALQTKESLKSRNMPYIGYIPIYSEDYINKLNNVTEEKFKNIMFPEVQ